MSRPSFRTSAIERALLVYARHFPVSRGKSRVVDLIAPLFMTRNPHRTAKLIHGGMLIPCDLREMLQRQYYFFGTYYFERRLMALWSRLARRASTVFDVGANAGIYSLAALAANRDANVEAFEPTPEIAERLRLTARINGLAHLQVHELAIGETSGTASLVRWRGEKNINGGMNFVDCAARSDGQAIDMVSLDEFCLSAGIDKIDLLKIDIQGGEPAALRGASRLLNERRIETILIELNWIDGQDDCSAHQTLKILEDFNFAIFDPASLTRPLAKGERPSGLSDAIATLNGLSLRD